MKYIRANSKSKLGENFTKSHKAGWVLVCFNPEGYPIFRESTFRWLRRIIFNYRDYMEGD